MKGKHANAADRRREMATLEQRATTAENERDRLARELADVTARRETEASTLRAELAAVRRQRDAASSPRVAELAAVNNRLRGERDQARSALDIEQKAGTRGMRAIADLLTARFGMSGVEAWELVHSAVSADDAGGRFMRPMAGTRDPGAIRAIQRAQGLRGGEDLTNVVCGDVPVEVHSRAESRAETARLMRELKSSLTPIYAYDDGPDNSLAVTATGSGLGVQIEPAEASIFLPWDEWRKLTQAVAEAETRRPQPHPGRRGGGGGAAVQLGVLRSEQPAVEQPPGGQAAGAVTDLQTVELLESLGAVPGKDWRIAKVDGKPEIMVSASGFRMLAEASPNPGARAAALECLNDGARQAGTGTSAESPE